MLYAAILGGVALGQAAPNVQYFVAGAAAGGRIWAVLCRSPRIRDLPGALAWKPVEEYVGSSINEVVWHAAVEGALSWTAMVTRITSLNAARPLAGQLRVSRPVTAIWQHSCARPMPGLDLASYKAPVLQRRIATVTFKQHGPCNGSVPPQSCP